jgi:hypothetical protein
VNPDRRSWSIVAGRPTPKRLAELTGSNEDTFELSWNPESYVPDDRAETESA